MGGRMEYLIEKYYQLLLTINPSFTNKLLNSLLFYVSFPFKLTRNLIVFLINKRISKVPTKSFSETLLALNTLQLLHTNELQTYVESIGLPNGSNHDTNNQAFYHGLYQYAASEFGEGSNPKIMTANRMFMQNKWLCNGFLWNPTKNMVEFNISSPRAINLLGVAIASYSENSPNENFDQIITHMIEDNDLCLIEGQIPNLKHPNQMYNRLLKLNNYRPELVKMKSINGLFNPGLSLTPTNALIILTALRVARIKNGNKLAGDMYNKLLFKYGYGLLSLMPDCDHRIVLLCSRLLSDMSKTKLGKAFWNIPKYFIVKKHTESNQKLNVLLDEVLDD
jgi:hypothetical protein